MQPMLTIALRAAHKAGEIIVQSFNQLDAIRVETKSANDYVTQVDKAAERTIIYTLKKSYPNHSFLGEESGLQQGEGKDAEYLWIIDPLDGTTNFIRGVPHFAVSIACVHRDRIEHAVIYDPMRDEEFCASRGHGGSVNSGGSANSRRLRVSGRKNLSGALLGTGFPFREDQETQAEHYFSMLKDLSKGTAGIRRFGAAALDLAWVAAGRFDGFWELGLKKWDMAAGCLLVTEAGGLVGDVNGGNKHLDTGNLVCGTPKCFKEILTRIQPYIH